MWPVLEAGINQASGIKTRKVTVEKVCFAHTNYNNVSINACDWPWPAEAAEGFLVWGTRPDSGTRPRPPETKSVPEHTHKKKM